MTTVTNTAVPTAAPAEPADDDTSAPPPPPGQPTVQRMSAGGVALRVGVWATVALLCVVLVLYGLEPLFQQRTQHELLTTYRADIAHAANEAQGLPGVEKVTRPPAVGAPVGVLEIARLHLQQVVVEGDGTVETAGGPGHVAGTAGPGQPGNSVLVGRRSMYGGPFGSLGGLGKGDRILLTTTQGQTVYNVVSSRAVVLGSGSAGHVTLDSLYRQTKDARLTLVTSDSASPWNTSQARVVVAKLVGQPFARTPQARRVDRHGLTSSNGAAWVSLLVALAGFALVAVAAVALYRRMSTRVAYLLATPVLLVFAILLAEALSRLAPVWT
jgi:sortase A